MKSTTVAIILCAGASYAQQVSSCTTTLADPAPVGLVCEVNGKAVVSKFGIRQFPTSSFVECRDLCLNDLLCQSFNYQQINGRCRILGTQTKTQQIKSRENSHLTFSNKACYDRAGICWTLNADFGELPNSGGLARPTDGALGSQNAQVRPWSIYYGPNDTESTVEVDEDENHQTSAKLSVSGSESLGLYQRVLYEQDPPNGGGLTFAFEEYNGSFDGNNDYTITIVYHGTAVRTLTIQPYPSYWTFNNGDAHNAYGEYMFVGFGSEFLAVLHADPDRSQERTFGMLLQGPSDDVAQSGIFGFKDIHASAM